MGDGSERNRERTQVCEKTLKTLHLVIPTGNPLARVESLHKDKCGQLDNSVAYTKYTQRCSIVTVPCLTSHIHPGNIQ